MRILIADADHRATKFLVSALGAIGHDLRVAEDGRAALIRATEAGFDAILLDMELPHVDGPTVVRTLRARGLTVPILMLSALGDLDHRLAGLDAGADDYLVKPAEPREIDARIRAIRRRAERDGEVGVMRAGDIEVNETKYRAIRGGRVLALPRLEFRVLCELVRHRGSVVTRRMFYAAVWNLESEPATNIVESYIRRVRRQLTSAGEPDPIVTIRGVGYMLVVNG